jgi:hypothetical protein
MDSLIGFLRCAEEVARRLSKVNGGGLRLRLLALADLLQAQARSFSQEV